MTDLNPSERCLIVLALLAVSPSGGGSYQYTLARKLCAEWGFDLALISIDALTYQRIAHREYVGDE